MDSSPSKPQESSTPSVEKSQISPRKRGNDVAIGNESDFSPKRAREVQVVEDCLKTDDSIDPTMAVESETNVPSGEPEAPIPGTAPVEEFKDEPSDGDKERCAAYCESITQEAIESGIEESVEQICSMAETKKRTESGDTLYEESSDSDAVPKPAVILESEDAIVVNRDLMRPVPLRGVPFRGFEEDDEVSQFPPETARRADGDDEVGSSLETPRANYTDEDLVDECVDRMIRKEQLSLEVVDDAPPAV